MPGPGRRWRRRPRKGKRSRLGLWTAVVLLGLVGTYLVLIDANRPKVVGDRLRLDSFVDLAERGRLRSAKVLDFDSYVVGTYTRDDESVHRYSAEYLKDTRERLVDILLENRVATTVDQQTKKRLMNLAGYLLPGLAVIVLLGYLILSSRRGTGLFKVKSGARKIEPQPGGTTFADVAGQDHAVAELREIKEFLADPERYAALGAQIPKGVLLYGPPGCGKTLLAKAVAEEAGASFYSISGSDFVEVYVGVGAARVRDLFKEARENAPAVIFIDELDSLGRSRAGTTGDRAVAHHELEQSVNQLLAELDGFSASTGVIVLGATNRPDVLDPALLRPGRFDRTIGLEFPNEDGRLAILLVHARGKVLDDGVDLGAIATKAHGLTGADLANLMNEAALLAARAGSAAIAQHHLDAAFQRAIEAPERQRRLSIRARSVGRRFSGNERVTFADVAGVDDAIEELLDVRDYLAEPARFAKMGATPPRGILLSGPPGCGKTLLARAVAGEANAAFVLASGSEFVEVFVGEGAARVRDLFSEARSMAPAIVFIDEIDAVGGHRGRGVGGHAERDQTLNQLLVEMDGFDQSTAVIVMAATNRPDILDTALVRPGRFDRKVDIAMPDRGGRRAILDIHAAGKPLAVDVDLDAVAGLTQGFSGADLANVLNEAALLATRRGAEQITMQVLDEAIDRAYLGISSRGHLMSDEEVRVVAYHEAGHALVARGVAGAPPLYKLTVLPRGGSLGHCTMLDDHDRTVVSRSALLARMAVSLGGWAAEKLVFGEPGSGTGSDLRRVNEIARRMVCELGMSEDFGPVVVPDVTLPDGREGPLPESATDAVRRLIDEANGLAVAALVSQRALLDRVASALLEHETLTNADIDALVGNGRARVPSPPPERPAAPGGRRGGVRRARPAGYSSGNGSGSPFPPVRRQADTG